MIIKYKKQFNTNSASKTFAMPLIVQSDDSLVHYGRAAARAPRRELVRVARRAVGAAGLE